MQRGLVYAFCLGMGVAAVTPYIAHRLPFNPRVDTLAIDFGCAAAWIVCAFGSLTVGMFNNARKWWIIATAPFALFRAFEFLAGMAFGIISGFGR